MWGTVCPKEATVQNGVDRILGTLVILGALATIPLTVAAHYPKEKKETPDFLRQQQTSNEKLMSGETDKYPLMEVLDAAWNPALPAHGADQPFGPLSLSGTRARSIHWSRSGLLCGRRKTGSATTNQTQTRAPAPYPVRVLRTMERQAAIASSTWPGSDLRRGGRASWEKPT
jgi:hypothetical protein